MGTYLDACREGSPHEDVPYDADEYVDELLGRLDAKSRRLIRRALISRVLAREPECPTFDSYVRGFSGENHIKVSAVIPVHNAGDYIHRCIASLQEQAMDGLEFVFVDDTSTDDSMQAVEAWAAADDRVRIVRNDENLGEGGSRNAGIRAAQGRYFISLDPDDWIGPNYFELLYSEALTSGADIVKGSRTKIEEGNEEELTNGGLNNRIRQGIENGNPLYLRFHYEHQTGLFRHLLFCEDTRYGVSTNACDTTFLLRICLYAESISFADDAVYYYLVRPGSATGSYSIKRSFAELVSLGELVDALRAQDDMGPAYKYLDGQINFFVSRFFQAICQEKVDLATEKAYVSQLSEHLQRIPNHARLYATRPELKPLVEEGVLLPPSISDGGNAYKAETRRWINYLVRPSATDDQAIVERFAFIVAQFIGKKCEEKEGYLGPLFVVLAQLRRLDSRSRDVVTNRMTAVLERHTTWARIWARRNRAKGFRRWKARAKRLFLKLKHLMGRIRDRDAS
ncbi:MAG: glycosyltransferase family 2 protein [Atopobiaceae bacterium]|nr:glycosyltransferase family 2 protein [Atopobiaceae bacterium]MBR3384506.1 glycosyltransferase family 2 protein [Atopobiaceae bacterium]